MLPNIFFHYPIPHDLLYHTEQVIAIDTNEKKKTKIIQTSFCLTLRRKKLFDHEMNKMTELS